MVKNVTISPDPVVSGEDATFIVPAYTGERSAFAVGIIMITIFSFLSPMSIDIFEFRV